MNHQSLVNEITKELSDDTNALALLLYGSVSRHEENENSDVDLLLIINENYCQKRHIVRYGITVEYLEMHIDYLQNFINKNEIPVLFTLAEGTVLFDKTSILASFISQAKNIIEKGPPVNEKWSEKKYATRKRYDITEIYMDLLDTDNEIIFHYLVSLFITDMIPLLNENYHLWQKTRKKTMGYLKAQCYDGYKHIETLLNPQCSLCCKRSAAKELIEYVLKKHGGILEGDAIIFKF